MFSSPMVLLTSLTRCQLRLYYVQTYLWQLELKGRNDPCRGKVSPISSFMVTLVWRIRYFFGQSSSLPTQGFLIVRSRALQNNIRCYFLFSHAAQPSRVNGEYRYKLKGTNGAEFALLGKNMSADFC